MTTPEDPEERIRQLEQSAAAYGARELGTDPHQTEATSSLPPPVYASPPAYGAPPSYGSYGDPYQPPFGTQYLPVKKSSVPVGLVVGLIAIVLVLLGGIAAVVWNVSSTIEDSGVAGGGGPIDLPGGATYTPPTISFPSLPGIPGSETEQTATPRAPASVSGVDGTKTVVCEDGDVSISGVNNTVTVTGHCVHVHVSGVENKVTVESTDTIGASGFDNEIVYLTGDPEISATSGNTVSRG